MTMNTGPGRATPSAVSYPYPPSAAQRSADLLTRPWLP
jgi:hypothetical protein